MLESLHNFINGQSRPSLSFIENSQSEVQVRTMKSLGREKPPDGMTGPQNDHVRKIAPQSTMD